MLSRPAGPTRGHFVLPRFLVLSVTPALPASACAGPAPEPGTARPWSRLLSVTRPGGAGLLPSPSLVPRAPPPEPRTTRRPLLSPCRAAWPAPGLVILAETTPQAGPSRSRTSRSRSRSRASGSLPRPRRATGLVLRAAGLPQPASASRRTRGRLPRPSPLGIRATDRLRPPGVVILAETPPQTG